MNNNEDIKFCSMSNPKKGCGDDYYCHIGYSEESTVCCLKINDNPCSQPIIRGGGPSSLSRFYYDSSTRTCLPFIYSGANGNMNNFVSKDECESTCPVLQNPCSDDQGTPATDDNGQYIFCASRADNTCPSGYFCHYGEFLSESICCPDDDEDLCSKPLKEGVGDKELIRWYFDSNLRRCSRFKYTGKGGNSNNFITLQECQMTCKEYQNPCSDGDPALSPNGEIIFCSSGNNSTCPSNYFCHHGAIDITTVCCPLQQQSDPCYGPLSIGNGLSKLSRWYFNHHTRQCLQFTYTGMNGNANNYLTEEECSNSCPVVVNPCPGIDRIYPKAFGESLKCSSDTAFLCPIGYWCHLGSTPETTLCCPNAQDPCKQELELGIRFKTENVKRWYYDSNSKECKTFVFRGLKGNQNNFLTKDDCIKTCPSFTNVCQVEEPYRDKLYKKIVNCDNSKDCPSGYFCHRGSSSKYIKEKNINNVCCRSLKHPCQDEVIIGNGKYSLPRWYFNTQKKQCMEFTYSGSGGSSNNFVSKEECAETCLHDNTNPCRNGEPYKNVYGDIEHCSPKSSIHTCPPKFFCHVGEDKDNTVCCPTTNPLPCQENMEIGYGDKQLSRYYYNYHLKECLPFIYTGMGGNSNNFISKEDCILNCNNNYPPSSRIQFSTSEWPWYNENKEVKKRSISMNCGVPQARNCKGSPIGYYYDSMSQECVPIRPCPEEPLDNIFWNINECTNICSDISNKRSTMDKEEDYLLIRSLGFLSQLLANSRDKGNLR
uniref:Kunitz/Bovine pancreatic trypsin inhibitor domain protein n=1 Tax=Strongyloides venezuelensis TaxID=75913 RepID=A0A0K0F1T3_STRVS